MDNDRNELIRARAYEIWEREGRPAGYESEHWRQAELELQEAAADQMQQGETAPGSLSAGNGTEAAAEAPKQGRRRKASGI